MEPKAFLAKMKPGAFATYKKYRLLPSITVAQAVIESGWGSSGLTRSANNLFGIKGSYKGQSTSMATQEDGPGGMYWITDGFRKYPSWSESILDYGSLLGTKQPYTGLRIPGDKSYSSVAAKLTGVYATDRGYAGKLIGIIQSNGLDKWDKEAFAGGDGGGFFGDGDQFRTFRTQEIKKNQFTRPGIKLKGVKGIVIHEIKTSLSASAYRKQLESGNSGRKMGFHIIADSKDAFQIVPFEEGVYHANRTGNRFISELGNPDETTISIGMIASGSGAIPDKTTQKAVLASGEILGIYKLPATKIFYGEIVDGVSEPTAWVNNSFLYSSFIALANSAKEAGQNVITNPDYDKDGEGGSISSGGLIPGGSGKVKELIKYALTFEKKITYILGARNITYGGQGDCASYTQAMFLRKTGVDIGPNTWAQVTKGKEVPVSQLRAGDLVFFNGDSSPPSHVGLVIAKNTMINLQTSGCIVENYNNWHSYGAPPYRGRRLFSDADYEQAFSPPVTSKPSVDMRKQYVATVSRPTPLYSSASSGHTVARMMPQDRARVMGFSGNSLMVSQGQWLRRGDSGITLGALDSKYSEIGIGRTRLKTTAYSAPSLSSPHIEALGTSKYVAEGNVVSVYAIKNGMALITQEGYDEEWVPAGSSYITLDLYDTKTFKEEVNFNEGATVVTELFGKGRDRELVTEDNFKSTLDGRSIIASELLLPVGSVLELKVPSKPSMNRDVVVVSNLLSQENSNVLEVLLSNGDAYNFGRRRVEVRLKDIIPKDAVPDFLKGGPDYDEEIFS